MAMQKIVEDAFEQTIKRHPYLFVFVMFVVLVCVGWSWKVYAQKVDVQHQFRDVEQQIERLKSENEGRFDRLERQAERRHLESQLRSLDSEIYQLHRIEQTGDANKRDMARLDDLRITRGQMARQLERIDK